MIRALPSGGIWACLWVLVVFASGCCFNYSGLKWENTAGGTPYKLFSNSLHADLSARPEWQAPISAAAFDWALATGGSFHLSDSGWTNDILSAGFIDNGTNAIFRRDHGSDRIWAGTLPVALNGCAILEVDIAFNNRPAVGFSPPNALSAPDTGDVETIVKHEFGHFMGLDHVFWPRGALMVARVPPNQTKGLHACDILGANCMYTLQRCTLCRPRICPAAMSASGGSLGVARRFADSVLTTTARGKQYLVQFATASNEAVSLLLGNATLIQQASDVVTTFAPYLDAYMQQTDLRFVVFTNDMYQQVAEMTAALPPETSPSLRAKLEDFQSHIQANIGLTFQEVIDRMLEVPPPPPPDEPPPPEEPPPDPCPGCEEPPMMYARMTDETAEILAGDEQTAQRAQTYLEPRVGYLRDYLEGGQQAASVYFTQAEFDEANQILQAVRANASPVLQAEIDRALQYLASRVGFSYKAIFDETFPR
jgi:hypothetical protein